MKEQQNPWLLGIDNFGIKNCVLQKFICHKKFDYDIKSCKCNAW